jgi:adenine-specific DNA-methyltransferase
MSGVSTRSLSDGRIRKPPHAETKALLERIILASSNPDDRVLDPFAGSFTTGATAVELGRKFVGIEINVEYVKMGLRRLSIGSHFSEIELTKVKNVRQKTCLKRVD